MYTDVSGRIFVLEYSECEEIVFSRIKNTNSAKNGMIRFSALLSMKVMENFCSDRIFEVRILRVESGEYKTLNKFKCTPNIANRVINDDPYVGEYVVKFNYSNVDVPCGGTYCVMIVDGSNVIDVDYFDVC